MKIKINKLFNEAFHQTLCAEYAFLVHCVVSSFKQPHWTKT